MKCENCGVNEATVRYYQNINGDKKQLHLCSDCAESLGFTSFSNIFSPMFLDSKNYDFLEEPQVCNVCHYSFDDYLKTGLFGCPNCYESFQDRLDSLFLKLHGKTRHVELGKENKTKKEVTEKSNLSKKDNKLDELKEKLKALIEEEKYEEAAVIRDKIKEIEGK